MHTKLSPRSQWIKENHNEEKVNDEWLESYWMLKAEDGNGERRGNREKIIKTGHAVT